MRNIDKKYISLIIIMLITMLFISKLSWAGLGPIIEPHIGSIEEDFSEFDDDENGSNTSENTNEAAADKYFNIEANIDNMRGCIASTIGEAGDANAILVLLFSLAALLQMGRTIAGTGDWVGFIIRFLVILAFLTEFQELYYGAEDFFMYLGDKILGGKSAYDVFWKSYYAFFEPYGKNYANEYQKGFLSAMAALFTKEMLLVGLVLISFIIAFAFYLLIYLIQACILIGLEYVGPIIIALAIIPEIDFTSSYLRSLFQVLFWTVVTAILIKIMSTMLIFDKKALLGFKSMLAFSAMNFCFASAFIFVPKISEMIFAGSGWSSLSNSLKSFGGKAATVLATAALVRAPVAGYQAARFMGKNIAVPLAKNHIGPSFSGGGRSRRYSSQRQQTSYAQNQETTRETSMVEVPYNLPLGTISWWQSHDINNVREKNRYLTTKPHINTKLLGPGRKDT